MANEDLFTNIICTKQTSQNCAETLYRKLINYNVFAMPYCVMLLKLTYTIIDLPTDALAIRK